MASKFNILPQIPARDDKELALKEYYESWRLYNSMKNEPFFSVFTGFKEKHLADLDGGPLKLYLYFGFAASNKYGDSWHSISKIAEFFDTQTRTIDNWISVLIDRQLIYRERKGKKSHTTYLIPYSDTILKINPEKNYDVDNQDLINDLVSKVKSREFLYGPIIRVHHIFQWGIRRKKISVKNPAQWILIITQRDNGVLIGHIYPLDNSSHLGISRRVIAEDETAVFESIFEYDGQPLLGIALTHAIKFNAEKNIGAFFEMMRELSIAEPQDLKHLPEVAYGELPSILEESDEGGELEEEVSEE